MIRLVLALLAGLWLAATPATAQVQRNFRADALRGAMVFGDPPEIALDNKPMRLAPGARIRGQNNMLVLSGSLTGLRLLVHYSLDPRGLVKDVWILTPDEAARRPWPTTAEEAQTWEFDFGAQTWTRK